MKGSISQPKAFISYSWTTPQHENWVLELAERLMLDGINIILDKWDLKEGHDKHVFMEQVVNDPEILKILIICDSAYQSKSNERLGGVGTEAQLISKEVYENIGQEKFIPIVVEYDEEGKPCLPHFIASRIFIDLSTEEKYESNYQQLVRNLYDRPIIKKPTIGSAPAYITDPDKTLFKTSRKLQEIKSALINGKQSAKGLTNDFLEMFVAHLHDFRIVKMDDTPFDQQVVESIEQLSPLKDDFVVFMQEICKYQEDIDIEWIHSFLEQLIPFQNPTNDVSSWFESDFDNFKFFNYELVLNLIAILLKFKKYNAVRSLLDGRFFFRRFSNLEYATIGVFNSYLRSLDDDRNKRLNANRISITADLIKERSTRRDITFEDIKQADLTIHYLQKMSEKHWDWFPRTSVYNTHIGIELFERLVSTKHFFKIKGLFPEGIENPNDLKQLVMNYSENKSTGYYDRFKFNIPLLEQVFKVSQIATLP